MLRLILTLCILPIFVDSALSTRISVTHTFKCNAQREWRYEIMYYEHDSWSSHETLYSTGSRLVEEPIKKFTDVFTAAGGDGPFDTHYEIYMKMSHTCTSSGIPVEMEMELGDVPVNAATFEFNSPERLLDVGA